MGNVFNVRTARRPDPAVPGDRGEPRCEYDCGRYRCWNAVQFPAPGNIWAGLCGYHHARQVHEHHKTAAFEDQPEECLFCPDPDSRVSRLHELRLVELAELPVGWLDGHGVPPTAAALAGARRLLGSRPDAGVGVGICPTEDGGIAVEDLSDPAETSELALDVEPDGSYVLFLPMLPADEHDPAYADGMRFVDTSALWCYIAAARTVLAAAG